MARLGGSSGAHLPHPNWFGQIWSIKNGRYLESNGMDVDSNFSPPQFVRGRWCGFLTSGHQCSRGATSSKLELLLSQECDPRKWRPMLRLFDVQLGKKRVGIKRKHPQSRNFYEIVNDVFPHPVIGATTLPIWNISRSQVRVFHIRPYSWWFRNPVPVEVGSFSYTRFCTSQVVQDCFHQQYQLVLLTVVKYPFNSWATQKHPQSRPSDSVWSVWHCHNGQFHHLYHSGR